MPVHASATVVIAALEICQSLRHARARGEGPLGVEELVARTGLDRDAVLWGTRVLEDEGLAELVTRDGRPVVELSEVVEANA